MGDWLMKRRFEKKTKSIDRDIRILEQKYIRKPQYSGLEQNIGILEDFEHWNENEWSIFGDGINVITEAKRTGIYGLRVDSAGVLDRDFIYKIMPSGRTKDEVTVDFYIRFNTLILEQDHNAYFFWMECSNGRLVYLIVRGYPGPLYRFLYAGISSGFVDASIEVQTGQWYKFTVYWKDGVTDGKVKIWLDDVLKIDETGDSSQEAPVNGYYFGNILSIGTSDTLQIDFDDIDIDLEE